MITRSTIAPAFRTGDRQGQFTLRLVDRGHGTLASVGARDLRHARSKSLPVPGIVFMAMYFIGASLGIVIAMIAAWRGSGRRDSSPAVSSGVLIRPL
jgi:hypothetical protein